MLLSRPCTAVSYIKAFCPIKPNLGDVGGGGFFQNNSEMVKVVTLILLTII